MRMQPTLHSMVPKCVCVWEKPAHQLLSHSRHIPQGSAHPLQGALIPPCMCVGVRGVLPFCRQTRLQPHPQISSYPHPRQGLSPFPQSKHHTLGVGSSRPQMGQEPSHSKTGVAEVEAGCLGRNAPRPLSALSAQIFPKHKAFLFLDIRNTHMLQSWEKETRRLKCFGVCSSATRRPKPSQECSELPVPAQARDAPEKGQEVVSALCSHKTCG